MAPSSPTPDSRFLRAHERISRLDVILKSVRNVHQVIAKETDREKLVRGVCDNLIDNRGYLSSLIVLFDDKGGLLLMADAGMNETSQLSQLREQIMNGELPHCIDIANAKHGVAIIDDVYSECGDCLCKRIFENRKVMSTRLEHGDKSYGVLIVSISLQAIADEIEQIADEIEQNLFQTVGNAIALALRYIEVDEIRKKAEDALNKQNSLELSVRNRIAEVYLTNPDEEVYGNILSILLEAMKSRYGVFRYLDENGSWVAPTTAQMDWDKGQTPEKKFVFRREQWEDSDWPTSIREKRPFMMNKPSPKTSDEDVRITRYLSIPLMYKDEVVGLIQIANKESDYNEKDVELMDSIGKAITPAFVARIKKEGKEKELARTNLILLESKQRAEAYFDFLAHDIANILSPVIAYADMLKIEPNNPEQVIKFSSRIVEQGHRASSLISNLRRLEHIEKTHPNEIDTIDLRTLFSTLEDDIRSGFPNIAVEISYDIPDVPSMNVKGGEWVENVLRCIYDNAVRYSVNPAVILEIRASMLQQKGRGPCWQIEIADHGPGIADNVKSHLGDNIAVSAGREFKGVASSLPFCTSMIKCLGGELLIQDRIPGDYKQGTRVTIRLPIGE